jgi:hypothetical protein
MIIIKIIITLCCLQEAFFGSELIRTSRYTAVSSEDMLRSDSDSDTPRQTSRGTSPSPMPPRGSARGGGMGLEAESKGVGPDYGGLFGDRHTPQSTSQPSEANDLGKERQELEVWALMWCNKKKSKIRHMKIFIISHRESQIVSHVRLEPGTIQLVVHSLLSALSCPPCRVIMIIIIFSLLFHTGEIHNVTPKEAPCCHGSDSNLWVVCVCI